MIFVTVGTQLPFDRLVRTVDAWAGRTNRSDVVAQIGPSKVRPQHIAYHEFVSPSEFARFFASAELVIAHAGMGSIITAMSQAKPIVVMPRSASLNEHRSDHQLSTARHFRGKGFIKVAMDEFELDAILTQFENIPSATHATRYASQELLTAVRMFISDGRLT